MASLSWPAEWTKVTITEQPNTWAGDKWRSINHSKATQLFQSVICVHKSKFLFTRFKICSCFFGGLESFCFPEILKLKHFNWKFIVKLKHSDYAFSSS